jgi:hypothetical protein
MSTQNAIQLAAAIQNKVGSSLISAQNLLPRAESAGVLTQAGASSLGVFLLRDLFEMQRRTYECVEKVAKLLQSQLDLAEEKERRERDQAAELQKEKDKPKDNGFIGPPAPNNDDDLDDIEDAINKGTFSELLTGGLTAALLAPQALKNLGKGLGKRLLKGGIYGAIAGFIADPIINYINDEFELKLSDDDKADLKLTILGGAVGFGVAGIPGALVGVTAGMAAKVAQYITGNLNADEIDDSQFAGTAIGGAAAAMFGTAKLGAYIKGGGLAAIGAKTTFGAALMSLPVIIGVGAAVALGVGAMFIAKKIDEYQEEALKKLNKTTAKLDREMGEWAAREEEGLFERFGINLGQLSALGEAQVAAAEANEQAGQNIEKFTADTATGTKLKALVDTMSNYSDESLKTILLDKTKAENYFSTIESLKAVAAKGGFGDESGAIFSTLSMMSDRVQNYAKKLVSEGVKGGMVKAAADNKAGRIRGMIEGGDQLENIPKLEAEKEKLLAERREVEKQLALEEQKLQEMKDAGMKSDGFFLTKNDFERQQDVVKDLAGKLVYDRNNPQNLQNRIDRLDTMLQKFGTTNGLLYNLDQLREIMTDAELKDLIQKSVNQQGTTFINEQNAANNLRSELPGNVTVTTLDQSDKKVISSSATTISKSAPTGDTYFADISYNAYT